jgi:hypothetical protein
VLCSRIPLGLEALRPVLSSRTAPRPYNAPNSGTKNFKISQLWLKCSWEYSQLQQLG